MTGAAGVRGGGNPLSPMPDLELKRETYALGVPFRASDERCGWPRCFKAAELFVDEEAHCLEHAPFIMALLIEDALILGFDRRGILWCRWCQETLHDSTTCPDLLGYETADGPGEGPSQAPRASAHLRAVGHTARMEMRS